MTYHNTNPIGIFDSGVGGLSVLSELQKCLPHESFIYLGDTARLPYGTKSPHIIEQYALRVATHLQTYQIKYLIIACNTASAFALDFLRQKFPDLPVIGVLEPGALAAAQHTQNKHIGIIGTEATIKSGAYELAIQQHLPDAQLISQACQLLIPLVEEGWANHPVTQQVIEVYLSPLKKENIDTLVLGCTHFSILKAAIESFMGPDVRLIDAADTGQIIHADLEKLGLLSDIKEPGTQKFLVTDTPEKFQQVMHIFQGESTPPIDMVSL